VSYRPRDALSPHPLSVIVGSIPQLTIDQYPALCHSIRRAIFFAPHESTLRRVLRGRDLFEIFLRIERSASVVKGILDLWTVVEYQRQGPEFSSAVSTTECIRQVEHEGRLNERRLPARDGQRLSVACDHAVDVFPGRRRRHRRVRDDRAQPSLSPDAGMGHRTDRAAARSWECCRQPAAAAPRRHG